MDEQFQLIMSQLKVLHMLVKSEDVKNILQEIDRTETLLPFIDPTKYREISPNIPGYVSILHKLNDLLEIIEKEEANAIA